jgi:hypothetical protein
MTDRTQIEQETEQQWQALLDATEKTQPGVVKMLQAYGEIALPALQAAEYLNDMTPEPVVLNGNASNG